ncbi:DUF5658 family protein [Papillibacter cinnamivorans]|uniref:DUF5658 domain-containing protein n=1 Tax=Papillibacter cinnamivorans DSM 12816 TaxID=1122930 RepID=A0A1W2AH33_9FIRM|nr:DUF5658 family protein [Papillibacter cinnamivorans]SMC59996.1 hypothetical protein SAMN02745168_1718 [Papillibacter cinnamivorans DSM 12816]
MGKRSKQGKQLKDRIKKAAAACAALTAADAFCTASGIRLGTIEEANPLFSGWISLSPGPAGLAAFLGTAALLALLYASRGRVSWIGGALSGIAAVKLAVLGLHFGWMLYLI